MDIVVFSGSRADVSPLRPVADILNAQFVHLTRHKAGTPSDVVMGTQEAMNEVTWFFQNRDRPDFSIVLGDRWEILGTATALNLLGIPIAHLSGGDLTEGSQDDCMRHAISKLSHLHFPTNEQSADRLLLMGEEAWRVHNVGCPGVDQVLRQKLHTRRELTPKICFDEPYILVAYQVATLANDPIGEAQHLLDALYELQLPCVFTTLNPDTYSQHIEEMFTRFCKTGRGTILDMPQKLFLSVMKYCQVMIGNSSSGFYEAPTLRVPFVNVGDRQKGRIEAYNVCSCAPQKPAIIKAANEVRARNLGKVVNPYGDGTAALQIKQFLETMNVTKQKLLRKRWGHGIQSDLGKDTPSPTVGVVPERGLGSVGV